MSDQPAYTTPPNSRASYYEALFTAATKGCVIIHLMWTMLFWGLGVLPMVLYNALSTCFFICSYLFLLKKHHTLWALLLHLEIRLHMVLASVTVGWETGFHYYFFILIFAAFMIPMYGRPMRIFLAVSDVVIYLLLYSYTPLPRYPVPDLYVDLVNIHNIVLVTVTIALLSSVFRKRITETVGELQNAASTDPLTGLLNRRSMYTRLEREQNRSQAHGISYCVLLCDIDNFKTFNDLYGHDCGDYVLRDCADSIRRLVRTGDAVSRWGGEEFLILLPETALEEAASIAERIRSHLYESVHSYEGRELHISLTFGLAACPPARSVNDCIQQADQALMLGKQEGKNRVVTQFSLSSIEP
ncbi:GGDEF domain-containing protein [Paenibacillus sp. S-38]|uniref:GGDEF domain-containing protein n=1 Tax=Paenibacillus sp. S-38 TaxID=3416710 RepID=UPI003CEEA8A4